MAIYFTIITKLFFTEKYDIESCQNIENQMNLNFTVNLEERYVYTKLLKLKFSFQKIGYILFTGNFLFSEMPVTQNGSCKFTSNNIFSRRPSVTVNKSFEPFVDDDTFEHIRRVTAHHDAVMAFYYMDEDNKVRF